jgi:hypothetical protein
MKKGTTFTNKEATGFLPDMNAGFALIEAILSVLLLGLLSVAATNILSNYNKSSAKIRHIGEEEDLRNFIRSNFSRDVTFGLGTTGNCNHIDERPIALKRSDESVLVEASEAGTLVADKFLIKATCKLTNGMHEIKVDYVTLKKGSTGNSEADFSKDPLTGKTSSWGPLFSKDPGAKNPPLIKRPVCLSPGIRWSPQIEPKCGANDNPRPDAFAGGTGTATDPFLISERYQLECVRLWLGASFKLKNDIDLQGYHLKPLPLGCDRDSGVEIDPNLQADQHDHFSHEAVFDGGGFAIKNLAQNGLADNQLIDNTGFVMDMNFSEANDWGGLTASPSVRSPITNYNPAGTGSDLSQPVGLFLHITNATVRNLKLLNVNIVGQKASAIVANPVGKHFSNLTVTGNITGVEKAAGMFLNMERTSLERVTVDVRVTFGEASTRPSFMPAAAELERWSSSAGGIAVDATGSRFSLTNVKLRFTSGQTYSFATNWGNIGGIVANSYRNFFHLSGTDIDTSTLDQSRRFNKVGGVAGNLVCVSGFPNTLEAYRTGHTPGQNYGMSSRGTVSLGYHSGGIAGSVAMGCLIDFSFSNAQISGRGTAGGIAGIAFAGSGFNLTHTFSGSVSGAIYNGTIVGGINNSYAYKPEETYNSNPLPCHYLTMDYPDFGLDPICAGNPLWNATSGVAFPVVIPRTTSTYTDYVRSFGWHGPLVERVRYGDSNPPPGFNWGSTLNGNMAWVDEGVPPVYGVQYDYSNQDSRPAYGGIAP